MQYPHKYSKRKSISFSFHYYWGLEDFDFDYLNLDVKIDKPLVLQEFGLPSSRGFWSPFGASEKKQADYHKTISGNDPGKEYPLFILDFV